MIKAYLRKTLGNFTLDAKIEESGIIAIIGKNGSGKTTFLKLISGILKPDFGYVVLDNLDITNLPIEKKNVVYLSYETYIPHFDVDKHILWGARNRKVKVSNDELKEIKESLGINFKGKIKNLSLGMRIRVILATSILAKPRLILADEIFSNLSDRK
ncbi:MAG: ATP-binding cassette domain-containing protein, partial [Sulfolobales archaeon]